MPEYGTGNHLQAQGGCVVAHARKIEARINGDLDILEEQVDELPWSIENHMPADGGAFELQWNYRIARGGSVFERGARLPRAAMRAFLPRSFTFTPGASFGVGGYNGIPSAAGVRQPL